MLDFSYMCLLSFTTPCSEVITDIALFASFIIHALETSRELAVGIYLSSYLRQFVSNKEVILVRDSSRKKG